VLRTPDVPEPTAEVRRPAELSAAERRWGLDARVADPADVEAVAQALQGRT